MTDTTTPAAHSAIRVLAALAELGETTAAAVAEHTGLGYSTVTPKLRTWEDTGQAERFRTGDGRTLWRLTTAGRTATAVTEPPGATQTADTPSRTHQSEPAADTAAAAVPVTPQEANDTSTPTDASEDADAVHLDSDPDTGVEAVLDAALSAVDGQPPAADRTAPSDNAPHDPTGAPSVDTTGTEVGDTTAAPEPTTADNGGPTEQDETTPARRAKGSIPAAVLAICEAHPDRQYRVGELCKLIDASNAGTDAKKASQGAVYNACTKLAGAGTLRQTIDKPATFQLTPASN